MSSGVGAPKKPVFFFFSKTTAGTPKIEGNLKLALCFSEQVPPADGAQMVQ